MNIAQAVPTCFAQACEQKLLSSLGKGISKYSERARNIAAGSKRMSSDLLHSDDTINSYANCLTQYARWIKEKDLAGIPKFHKKLHCQKFLT